MIKDNICFSLVLALLLTMVFIGPAVAEAELAPVYIDVRTWMEHKLDSIEGNPRIHVSEIVAGVDSLITNKDTPIYLYCAVGGRSGQAAAKLTNAGYTNVHNAGGIDDVRRNHAKVGDKK